MVLFVEIEEDGSGFVPGSLLGIMLSFPWRQSVVAQRTDPCRALGRHYKGADSVYTQARFLVWGEKPGINFTPPSHPHSGLAYYGMTDLRVKKLDYAQDCDCEEEICQDCHCRQ